MTEPRTTRRWFRFSLRTMLVMLVCAMSSPAIGSLHRPQAQPLKHRFIHTNDLFQIDRALVSRAAEVRKPGKRRLPSVPDHIEQGMMIQEREFRESYQWLLEIIYP